jgi:hypothetical protein
VGPPVVCCRAHSFDCVRGTAGFVSKGVPYPYGCPALKQERGFLLTLEHNRRLPCTRIGATIGPVLWSHLKRSEFVNRKNYGLILIGCV